MKPEWMISESWYIYIFPAIKLMDHAGCIVIEDITYGCIIFMCERLNNNIIVYIYQVWLITRIVFKKTRRQVDIGMNVVKQARM